MISLTVPIDEPATTIKNVQLNLNYALRYLERPLYSTVFYSGVVAPELISALGPTSIRCARKKFFIIIMLLLFGVSNT